MDLGRRELARLGFGMATWNRTVHKGNREIQALLKSVGCLEEAGNKLEPAAVLSTCKRYVETGRMTQEQAQEVCKQYGIL